MPAPRAPGLRVEAAGVLVLLLRVLACPAESVKQHDCILPKPRDVHFSSVNMKNVLHWLPPEGLGDGVLYTVKYKMYGTKEYHCKFECKNISKTWCDLSNETSDYEEHYYAKVKASSNYATCSKWAETDRFFPKTDTKIGPPTVNVYSSERSISINLTGPVKWNANPNDIVSFHEIYSRLEYEVSILNKKTHQWWKFHIQNNSLDINKLSPNTTYCVTTRTFVPVPYKLSEPSQLVCTNTLEDRTAWLMTEAIFWYSLPVAVAVLFVLAVGCAMYKYIHVSKQKPPTNLILHCRKGYNGELFIPHEQVVINFINMNAADRPLSIQKSVHCNLQDGASQDFAVSPDESNNEKTLQGDGSDVKHLGYAVQVQEDSTCDLQQELKPLRAPQGFQCTSVLNDIEESVEYGLVMRATDFSPAQEQRELYLEEMSVGRSPSVYNSHNPLMNACFAKLEQAPCLQLRTVEQSPCLTLNDIQQEQTEAEEEECSTVVVDWDPQTKRLTIPNLSYFISVRDEDEACTQRHHNEEEEGLLSKLYKQQMSEEQPEDDDDIDDDLYLKQFKDQWELHVQMEE
ncbi:interleukin-20 receptor subunit alpha [Rhinatrema bivittatum]|uniref:interleukin-20 receptor subunit alpha n=1 Tax=Rhinatrema bivittatum TaxID=194408 RepID=UPI00112BED0E|nr:interleukin-20 receptor subunit alpha [Rhinatrema bivittatum]